MFDNLDTISSNDETPITGGVPKTVDISSDLGTTGYSIHVGFGYDVNDRVVIDIGPAERVVTKTTLLDVGIRKIWRFRRISWGVDTIAIGNVGTDALLRLGIGAGVSYVP